jgi:ABC-2 type transport system permease protein
MIGTLLRISWINLRRDRVAQAMTFALPIMFFSIFATIFGHQGNVTPKIRLPVVDEDRTEYSVRLVKALAAEGALDVQTTSGQSSSDLQGTPLTRADAERLIKAGTVAVAVVLPKGLGESSRFFGQSPASRPAVQILADVSDPIAPQVVGGLLEKVSFTAMPEAMAQQGIAMFEQYGGPLTPAQRESTEHWLTDLAQGRQNAPNAAAANPAFGLPTEIVNVLQPNGGSAATISFYAAGTGVMFLLFSCAGAGGALLDEEESGTLGRLLSGRVGMRGVLVGKWLFLTLLGMAQLTVMFAWGALAFHLPLLAHLPGFIVMTALTAGAAAGFGLVLATMSRSRQQLAGISTILILAMSAVGGSMFPRFLMSETMQKIGLITFNAWALDGYLKVFWREAPLTALWPQAAVLLSLTVVFGVAARLFARRWEAL